MTKVEQAVEVMMQWENSEISDKELKTRMAVINPSWSEIDEAQLIVNKKIGRKQHTWTKLKKQDFCTTCSYRTK